MCDWKHISFTKYGYLVIILATLRQNTLASETGSVTKDGHCEKLDDGSVQCSDNDDITLVQLDANEIGHIENIGLGDHGTYQLKTVSHKPIIFEVPDFLTPTECDHFIDLALEEGLKNSDTHMSSNSKNMRLMDLDNNKELSLSEMMLTLENSFDVYLNENDVLQMYNELGMDLNKDGVITVMEMSTVQPIDLLKYADKISRENANKRSRVSQQIWLFPNASSDSIFQSVQDRVQKLTKMPTVLIKKSHFQIVRYDVAGHYNAHHDSSNLDQPFPCCKTYDKRKCRTCRFMTILFYLNDVEEGGGTAFPIAGNETYDVDVLRGSHKINLVEYCDDAPLIVTPKKGKAVMWYNHHVNQETGWMGELDNYAWHGGCPVIKGNKWIANFWVRTGDTRDDDLA